MTLSPKGTCLNKNVSLSFQKHNYYCSIWHWEEFCWNKKSLRMYEVWHVLDLRHYKHRDADSRLTSEGVASLERTQSRIKLSQGSYWIDDQVEFFFRRKEVLSVLIVLLSWVKFLYEDERSFIFWKGRKTLHLKQNWKNIHRLLAPFIW